MEKEKENNMIKSLCRRHILTVCKENSVFKKIYHNEDQSKELIEIEIVYLLSKINLTQYWYNASLLGLLQYNIANPQQHCIVIKTQVKQPCGKKNKVHN